MAYNAYQKLVTNIEALRTALEWKEGEELSSSQQELLVSYSGFGGIKPVLYPNSSKEEWLRLGATSEDLRLHPKTMELHDLLQKHYSEKEYQNIIQSIKNSVLTAFYTPAIVPKTIYDGLKQKGISPKAIYEPSAGAGIFITEAIKSFPNIQQITAVEKDIVTGTILKALASSWKVKTDVQVKGFEETPADEKGKYDLIVSNIPFGNFRVDDNYNKILRSLERFAISFLQKALRKQ
jgi:type I restriction-modification system DNA methylase subunit